MTYILILQYSQEYICSHELQFSPCTVQNSLTFYLLCLIIMQSSCVKLDYNIFAWKLFLASMYTEYEQSNHGRNRTCIRIGLSSLRNFYLTLKMICFWDILPKSKRSAASTRKSTVVGVLYYSSYCLSVH